MAEDHSKVLPRLLGCPEVTTATIVLCRQGTTVRALIPIGPQRTTVALPQGCAKRAEEPQTGEMGPLAAPELPAPDCCRWPSTAVVPVRSATTIAARPEPVCTERRAQPITQTHQRRQAVAARLPAPRQRALVMEYRTLAHQLERPGSEMRERPLPDVLPVRLPKRVRSGPKRVRSGPLHNARDARLLAGRGRIEHQARPAPRRRQALQPLEQRHTWPCNCRRRSGSAPSAKVKPPPSQQGSGGAALASIADPPRGAVGVSLTAPRSSAPSRCRAASGATGPMRTAARARARSEPRARSRRGCRTGCPSRRR
jgi:hypothetical protein